MALRRKSDASRGEAIVLFTTDAALTRDALVESPDNWTSRRLLCRAKFQHIDALPLLGSGKTDYVTLKQLAEKVP